MSEKHISLISKNYAKALMDISMQNDSVVSIKADIAKALDVLNSSYDLKLVMDNSSISTSKKIEIIEEIFKDKISQQILNLLRILVEKGRFDEFENIVLAYNEMADNLENRKNVEIISSFDLDVDIKGKILSKLEKKLNSEVIPQWSIDESIIAGLVFRFEDSIIDTSVKSKLEKLSKYMLR